MVFIDFYSRSRKGLLFHSGSATIAWLQAVPALAPQHYLEVQASKISITISVFWIRIRNFFQGLIRNDKWRIWNTTKFNAPTLFSNLIKKAKIHSFLFTKFSKSWTNGGGWRECPPLWGKWGRGSANSFIQSFIGRDRVVRRKGGGGLKTQTNVEQKILCTPMLPLFTHTIIHT